MRSGHSVHGTYHFQRHFPTEDHRSPDVVTCVHDGIGRLTAFRDPSSIQHMPKSPGSSQVRIDGKFLAEFKDMILDPSFDFIIRFVTMFGKSADNFRDPVRNHLKF